MCEFVLIGAFRHLCEYLTAMSLLQFFNQSASDYVKGFDPSMHVSCVLAFHVSFLDETLMSKSG